MRINVLNYSKVLETNMLQAYIEGLAETLANKGVDMSRVTFTYNDHQVVSIVNELVEKYENGEPLLNNLDFQLSVNEIFNEEKKVVLVGEDLRTVAPWGDAWEIIAVVSFAEKVAIWHEVAHLLGAEDHYDYDTKAKVDNCKLEKCIMQYGCYSFEFCDQAILEIQERLLKASITDNH